jgi:hypothetical protein
MGIRLLLLAIVAALVPRLAEGSAAAPGAQASDTAA